tara:strand:+ start:2020 stop:2499 length:480 start_codon:yes stop_codon:yes gene_type:complete
MKIFLNNRKLTFEGLELKNNIIYLSKEPILIPYNNYQVNYQDFINFIKNSLENYISLEDKEPFDVLSDYWNYFKITNNPIVKENMSFKICHLIINSNFLWNSYKFSNLVNSHKIHKPDKFYTFMRILTKLKNVEIENEELVEFDEERFTLLDFLLEYNI